MLQNACSHRFVGIVSTPADIAFSIWMSAW